MLGRLLLGDLALAQLFRLCNVPEAQCAVPTAGVVGGIAVVALIAGIATLLAAAGAPGLLVLGLALFALGTGVYAFKAVITTGKPGERFQVIRLVTVT